jgi:FixJ family two-component response regulator
LKKYIEKAPKTPGEAALTALPTDVRPATFTPFVVSEPDPIVIVVDDDASFLRSVQRLIRAEGFKVLTFSSAEEFLLSSLPDAPACLVLDVQLPDWSGLDLQRQLVRVGLHIPIIFMTGHGDIPMSVQAMKAGAAEFLAKPFEKQDLLQAIAQGIERARVGRKQRAKLVELRGRYESLTTRQREVMAHVVSGMPNKQIAAELGTTEKTVKFHRAHMMHKMLVGSVADLVRAATALGVQGNN